VKRTNSTVMNLMKTRKKMRTPNQRKRRWRKKNLQQRHLTPLMPFFSSPTPAVKNTLPPKAAPKGNSFDDLFTESPVVTPVVQKFSTPKQPVLSGEAGGGLAIECSFSRSNSLHGTEWNVVQLYLKNVQDVPITNIKLLKTPSFDGSDVHPFQDIAFIPPQKSFDCPIHIKFTFLSRSVSFEIGHGGGTYPVKLSAPAGELLRENAFSVQDFDKIKKQLSEIGESEVSITNIEKDAKKLSDRILSLANVSIVSGGAPELKFSAKSNQGTLILISANTDTGKVVLSCADASVRNAIVSELKKLETSVPAAVSTPSTPTPIPVSTTNVSTNASTSTPSATDVDTLFTPIDG